MSRLYVSRLPPDMTEQQLREVIEERTGTAATDVLFRSRYAFVDMPEEIPQETVIQQLNGHEVMGSQLLVEPSRTPSKKGNIVHIYNIPEEVPWEEFTNLATTFGTFQTCEKGPLKHKGYTATITYENPEDAQQGQSKLRRYEIRPGLFLRAEVEGSRGVRGGRQTNNLPLRILVPSEMVGAIIGRGGAAIRRITQQSRARVDVHRKENAGSPEKVVTIFGTPDNCSTACQKILELMQLESDNTNRGDVPLKLLAHNNLIGRIIGKKGTTIKSIMEQSSTKVTCSGGMHDSFSVERVICVKGNVEGVGQAERLISAKLRQSYANDMVYPHHPPPAYHPVPPMAVMGPPVHPSYGGIDLPKESVCVYVPSSAVGAIIGTGGATVREMIRSSGATIKVAVPGKDEEDTGERRVCIVGNIEGLWKAQFMVFRKVAFEGFQGARELKVEVQVPTRQVGRIIGKGGRTVRELQRHTHAIIRFPQEKTEEEMTAVHIIGDFYCTQAAQRQMRCLVQRSPPNEMI